MSAKVINSFDETTLSDFINSCDTLYINDIKIHLTHYRGYDDYRITDVKNALKTGAACNNYSITSNAPIGNLEITNWIYKTFNGKISGLYDYLNKLNFTKSDGYSFDDIVLNIGEFKITFGMRQVKAVNTYSPFNHANIKPLTEIPTKWTLKHVTKAIINKQFDNLKCNMVLTDDYAYDNACNFRKGEIKNANEFIKKIIESPSGWWTSIVNDKHVSICCHSFDSNSFDLNMSKDV